MARLLVPHTKYEISNKLTIRWYMTEERIVVETRKKIEKREKWRMKNEVFFCLPYTDTYTSPDQEDLAPILEEQLEATKDEQYRPLFAIRRISQDDEDEDDEDTLLIHVAHGQYVSCFDLKSIAYDDAWVEPVWPVYDHHSTITRIGFADPKEINTAPVHETHDDMPLFVRSLSKIAYLNTKSWKF